MKLVRFGPAGQERPGVWLEQTPAPGQSSILDVRAMAFDIEDFNGFFFSRWGLQRLQALLRESDRKLVPADGVRLGPPVARPGKIICLGKNYADHAAELDAEIPERPILFAKAATALSGPFDPIVLPPGSKMVDVEVELAVVIGKQGRHVPPGDAMDMIAAYTVLDDVTDREAQRADKQWFRAKSCDTFCPLGPFLVTPDEVAHPRNLSLYSKINSQVLQQSNTSHMIFDLARVISYISAAMTLEPGDLIATGTPGGIGSARKPPVVLHPGDTVELGIAGLGAQRNPVVAL